MVREERRSNIVDGMMTIDIPPEDNGFIGIME